MNEWTYRIVDTGTGRILREDAGYETETDAEDQARLEIQADNIRGVRIETFREWKDI